jgi:undecaprenyl-diphosphatase
MTIAVALILGLGFEFSFRFSFLLFIPAILGAALLEIDRIPPQGNLVPQLFLAVLVSALAGLLALKLLKKIMVHEKFHRFGIYVLAVGILVLIFL